MKTCSVKGCTKKHCAKGLCPMHYRRKNYARHIPMNAPPKHVFGKGFIVDKDGYKQVRNEFGKYVREHRLIKEKETGRKLLRTELVHHKNGVLTDNRIENLEIMTFAKHARLHNLTIPKSVKEDALRLYKNGMSLMRIPKEIPISYSCAYWYIRNSGFPIRGR